MANETRPNIAQRTKALKKSHAELLGFYPLRRKREEKQNDQKQT